MAAEDACVMSNVLKFTNFLYLIYVNLIYYFFCHIYGLHGESKIFFFSIQSEFVRMERCRGFGWGMRTDVSYGDQL